MVNVTVYVKIFSICCEIRTLLQFKYFLNLLNCMFRHVWISMCNIIIMCMFEPTLKLTTSGVFTAYQRLPGSDYFTRSPRFRHKNPNVMHYYVEACCVQTPIKVIQPLRGLNTIPPAAGDGQEDKRRAMLFPPSPCFPLPVSYTAVSLNYLGHQLASRR